MFFNDPNDIVKNNQDNDFNDSKITNRDSSTVNRNSSSDKELVNKNYVDETLGSGDILGFNQTLQNFSKASVGNDTYNITKRKKIQITDKTIIKYRNTVGCLLQIWVKKRNDKNNKGKILNFIKSTKTNSPNSFSGAMSLPPIGDSFMYIETSSKNRGNNVFVSFERTDNIQISNITFYYNRFSILTNEPLK